MKLLDGEDLRLGLQEYSEENQSGLWGSIIMKGIEVNLIEVLFNNI